MNEVYEKQVELLLAVLPEVAKEECFALHGGTAINLFLRNMPRLSVDIDLTYVEIAARKESLGGINKALVRIKERVEKLRPTISAQHLTDTCKLRVDEQGVVIKVEVNMIGRGLIGKPNQAPLCDVAQERFDVFCEMRLVPFGQLYGGKLCAALDRQHPRDLFDVKLLLDNEGFTDDIMTGLVFGLVSSNRPVHELLDPHLLDQREVFDNQFQGMTMVEFSYDDYQRTKVLLIEMVRANLSEDHKAFLLSVSRLEPDWSIFDFQRFPSVRWKLLNLERFRDRNSGAFEQQLRELEKLLD